ncbi:MAG TPA: hypothetical protein VN961_01990 [Streptosporangiaceae bacterium]|nr:hypothetical protein [Streptosporangiaceae bacterium]
MEPDRLAGGIPPHVDNDLTVINPAAMPAGTELFFGYFVSGRVHEIRPGLIYTSSHLCSTGWPLGGAGL